MRRNNQWTWVRSVEIVQDEEERKKILLWHLIKGFNMYVIRIPESGIPEIENGRKYLDTFAIFWINFQISKYISKIFENF